MNEILFKAKQRGDKEWVYGYYVRTIEENDDYSLFEKGWIYDHEGWRWNEVIPETVGQYTGLDDKNGVKIFEGETLYTKSIIKQFENELLHEVTGNVVIENGMTYLKGICKHGYLGEEIESRPYRAILLSPEIFEVIGNIHDNPQIVNLLNSTTG